MSDKATVLALLQIRGGTGKTTITNILGGELAKRGNRVLMIDLDSNAALTADLGFFTSNPKKCIGEIVRSRTPLSTHGLIHETRVPNLHLVPNMEGYQDETIFLQQQVDARLAPPGTDLDVANRTWLADILKPVLEDYDYILLDTVSKEDAVLTRMALYAAEYVLVTTRPKSSDVPKVQGAMRYLLQAREFGNPDLKLLGIPLTWIRRGATFKNDLKQLHTDLSDNLHPFIMPAIRDSEHIIRGARWHGVPPPCIPTDFLSDSGPRFGVNDAGARVNLVDGLNVINVAKSSDGTTALTDMADFVDCVIDRLATGFADQHEAHLQAFAEEGEVEEWQFRAQREVMVIA